MRKLIMMLALLIGVTVTACAGDTYAHSDAVLPLAAKTTLKKNFKAKVSVVKIEKTLGRVSEYEVVLDDGTEITFDRDGNWDNVETSDRSAVPDAFIPAGVKNYVKKNHPGLKVVGIDKEHSGFDVELSNGLDLEFNKSGQFVRYDD